MASKIEICNLALSRLGCKPIISFSDNTSEARILASIYDQVAENVMSMGPWTSCIKRATLAELTDSPEWGYVYQYQLPVNPKCLKVLSVNEGRLGDMEYRIEQDRILADASSMQIQYIAFLTDTTAYDAYLRQAITERLIVELAYTRTGSERNLDAMEKVFSNKLEMLLNLNNTQGSSYDLPSDTFIDVRFD